LTAYFTLLTLQLASQPASCELWYARLVDSAVWLQLSVCINVAAFVRLTRSGKKSKVSSGTGFRSSMAWWAVAEV